ncbi:agmatine deiminase family protein, partial [Campylobacter coli]
KALPKRKIIGVDARVFLRQNGSLHCSCQNRFKGLR